MIQGFHNKRVNNLQSSPKPLVTNKDFQHFTTKITVPTNSTEKYSVNPPSPQVNVVCLDSGDVLHDFFRVREINNIDLGGKGGHLLFRSTFFRFVTRVLVRIV